MNIWYAKKDEIETEETLLILLDGLSESEKDYVMKYVHFDDRKRSLLSFLLQHALISSVFKTSVPNYSIKRSRENKPFVCLINQSSGNWNYNLSHHGDYVAITSSYTELVGIDIVDTQTRAPTMANNASEFFNIYRKQLSRRELNDLDSINIDELKYIHFFILWSLKEAFIKAIGAGFGFDPSKVDFVITYSPNNIENNTNISNLKGIAVATINGVPRRDWYFDFQGLDDHHLFAVARGPIGDAIPSFRDAAGLICEDSVAPQSTCVIKTELKSIASLLN